MQDFKKVILGTGNYNNVKEGNRVSVTGDGGNAWGYFDASYKKLSPKLITYIPYKENLERLKELVRSLQSGELTLDESLKAFEEGIKLSKTL